MSCGDDYRELAEERELRKSVDNARALVWNAALELGRMWEANSGPFVPPELTEAELVRLNTLAQHVVVFDTSCKALEAHLAKEKTP